MAGSNLEHNVEKAMTTEGLPVSPSLGPALDAASVPVHSTIVDGRVVLMCAVSILLAVASAFIAEGLMRLIALITHLSFHQRFSFDVHSATPADNHLGVWVMVVPVIGGIIVGIMARYGSKAIRGHGIPEAMEQVLLNQSRIPPRVTFLKPLSAAFAIGTGGPFGAEGPIIATGGALGSVIGQMMSTTAAERKTLLAAGAAAGMAATFGSPVSAVLLAVELLLFEFRPRSLIPVALSAATAAGVRVMFEGTHPVFAMPDIGQPTGAAMAVYILLGAIMGLASVFVTRAVYWVEDVFEHYLKSVHWMWWPAIGAVAVGVIGYFAPRTLGVGYYNISDIISNNLTLKVMALLFVMKFISWAIALGSGTSGGTLAPLFTIGSGIGALIGAAAAHLAPHAGIDVRVAALVGMAAIFAGASRAMLASAVFAFETTLQPLGLLPLLGGCTASFLVSCLLMANTIMTEKLARRGVRVPAEYQADFLDQVLVRDVIGGKAVTLAAGDTLGKVREWIAAGGPGTTHQGYPVVDGDGVLLGVLTRRTLLDPKLAGEAVLRTLITMPPKFVYPDVTLRDAADHMVNHDIGRLPVMDRQTRKIIGVVTRSDLLRAHRRRLDDVSKPVRHIQLPGMWRRNGAAAQNVT